MVSAAWNEIRADSISHYVAHTGSFPEEHEATLQNLDLYKSVEKLTDLLMKFKDSQWDESIELLSAEDYIHIDSLYQQMTVVIANNPALAKTEKMESEGPQMEVSESNEFECNSDCTMSENELDNAD
ncbi:hypothetical protein HK096_009916, partial [Nowakowskiella sp. JEL0078]